MRGGARSVPLSCSSAFTRALRYENCKSVKNYAPIALATLALALALLLGLAACYPWLQQWQARYETRVQLNGQAVDLALKYQDLDRIFTFLRPEEARQARQQIARLIAREKKPSPPGANAQDVDSGDSAKIINPIYQGQHALDGFFMALGQLQAQPQPLRIAHYGDSQIEGDRLTVFLRALFQQRFGGRGIGYVPMAEPATSQNFVQREHTNFVRYSVFHNKLKSGEYALGGCMWRLPKGTEQGYYAFELAKGVAYDQLKLMWGNAPTAWQLRVYLGNDSLLYTEELPAAAGFQLTQLRIPAGSRKLRLEILAPASPDLYGLLFDGNTGLTVDNYSIRGHAGNGLLEISSGFMQQQYARLNTKLVILQYGGNVVPYIDVEDFGWLEQANYNLIRKFRSLLPDASILVIGVGDAAYKNKEGELTTWPTVEKIRNAQKRAALRAGVAFWDLWRVMGGPGSIVAWAAHNPPLAGEDYAHLTWHGQRLIATALFQSLMHEYERFRQRLAATHTATHGPGTAPTMQARKPNLANQNHVNQ
jgi:hypothetical protein